MEDPIKDLSATSVTGSVSKSRLRYPLRSSIKSKEEKSPALQLSNTSSTPTRSRIGSSVSQSLGVLDLSGKDKSIKPPRRLSSVQTKSIGSATKRGANITPISETRAKRSVDSRGKNEIPISYVSKSTSRNKFSSLSSASYWLSQIKLSETAANHSISLGFFKLALEAGCEPIQRMREELKSYANRHNLGDAVKELFESYDISNNPQVSKTCSHVDGEGTIVSDDEVHATLPVAAKTEPTPKSLNTSSAAPVSTAPVTIKKPGQKTNNPLPKIRRSLTKNSVNTRTVPDKSQKKVERVTKLESKDKNKVKKQGKKAAGGQEGQNNPTTTLDNAEEDKENAEGTRVEESSLIEA